MKSQRKLFYHDRTVFNDKNLNLFCSQLVNYKIWVQTMPQLQSIFTTLRHRRDGWNPFFHMSFEQIKFEAYIMNNISGNK